MGKVNRSLATSLAQRMMQVHPNPELAWPALHWIAANNDINPISSLQVERAKTEIGDYAQYVYAVMNYEGTQEFAPLAGQMRRALGIR